MAVHEFNHAVQFSYGFAWEFWWWEATATYVESQVYPDSNWWAYYVTGYTDSPGIAFNASDQNDQDIFWHMYGMAIWAAYMDEYLGGHETVLATWQASDNERGTYTFGMPDAFEEIGLDFDAAYTDFIAKNTVMLYEAQNVLPSVDETRSIDELPASANPDRDERPEGYGQVYTRIEAGAGEGELVLDFEGEDDIAWSVQLVEVDRDEILRVEVAEIVDGVGTVSLADFGDEDVVVVVSPLEYDGSRHSYEWSAYIAEPPPGDDTGGDTDALVDGDGEEKPGGGCGCDSGGTQAAGALALLGFAALSRRRR
jgi:MYXO-CTERM domain-containing protein